MTPLEVVLDRLRNPKKTRNGFSACCPAHNDSSPSLHIAEGADRRVLLKCFAGCDYREIMLAIGLDEAAGFVREKSKRYGPSRAALLTEVAIVRYYEAMVMSCANVTAEDTTRYELALNRLGRVYD